MITDGMKFEVSVETLKELTSAINLFLQIHGSRGINVVDFSETAIIFGDSLWASKDSDRIKFPFFLSTDIMLNLVKDYFNTPKIEKQYSLLASSYKGDGDVVNGWTVYSPQSLIFDAEHGMDDPYHALLAVRPSVFFYGK